jgi:putative protease
MELLSPAGDLHKLKYAVLYGADAVYTAGTQFGLRAKSGNLTREELKQAVEFCHKKKKQIYITVNIFAHNKDIDKLPDYLQFLQSIGVDAFIISDPGVFSLAREYAPEIPIHISTQANVTSWKSAEFWFQQGAKRIILARELSISEIKKIREKVPGIELEIFVHGAMCISYSGRCLLSSFLNNRSANQGYCTQPCRWEYGLAEKTRPNEFFSLEEDKYGSYILNSKDLCLLDKLGEIIDAGLDSIKIEGRMKSHYYVANVTRTYKSAIKLIFENKKVPDNLKEELNKVSHRHYTEGFFDNFDSTSTQFYESSSYIRDYQFIGEIVKTDKKSLYIAIRAKFSVGDKIEVIFPDMNNDLSLEISNLYNEKDEPISFTKPNTIVRVDINKEIPPYGIVRKNIRK